MDDITVLTTRHKFTVDDYHRMGDAGILGEADRVELIEGEIIEMAPIGQDHAGTVNRLTEALVLAFTGRAIVSTQNPVRLDDRNEPQPDFAVLRHREDFYTTGEPAGPADILLLIEVAATSLRFDRAVKLPLYARTGLPEVWIIDLQRRAVEVHRAPDNGRYTDASTIQNDGTLTPALAPDVLISLRQIFG